MFSFQPEMQSYTIVDSRSKLKRLARKMREIEEFAFDTETNTLRVLGKNKDFSLVGISISWGEYDNYYIPVGHLRIEDYGRQLDLDEVVECLKPIFEREDVRIIGHNLKFDMHVLARVGIIIKTKDLFDTMIASWLCDENSPNGLKDNSNKFLGIDQTHFKDVVENVPAEVKKEFGLKSNSKATFDLTLIDEAAPYALADSFNTWELYLGFLVLLEEEKMDKIFYRVYVPFIKTLFDMEERGVTVDLERLEQMSKDINADMEQMTYDMFEIAGVEFNPSSSQQLAELLFGYSTQPKEVDLSKQPKIVQKMFEDGDEESLNARGLYTQEVDGGRVAVFKMTGNPALQKASFNFRVVSKTAGGAPQTNANVFWTLSRMEFKNKRKQEGVELCKVLMDYKKLDKLRSAFIDGLKEQIYDDGKVHPSFNIIGTDSGRLSCSQPNLDLTVVGHYTVMCNSKSRENGEVLQVA